MAFLKRFYVLFVYYAVTMMVCAKGNVVLMGHNISKSFDDMEANFTPRIKGSGESGILYVSDPLNACFPLNNKIIGSMKSPFVLIVRGGCSFDDKVRNAQNAGFKAAIIYDSEENAPLVAMGGTQLGVKIHAVFISKDSGKELIQYTNSSTVDIWILPSFEDSPWSIMAVSFIALLAMSAVLATCFFVHKHHGRQEMNIAAAAAPPVQEFHGMSRRLVKAMPSLIFTTVLEDKSTSSTCAICLDDYSTGEKIRVLPCFHKFHAICVDSWLTSWRTFCPVCKRDARTSIDIPAASESTPLLSSLASSSSALNLPSCPSSLAASSSIPIVPTHPLSTSRSHSLATSHHHLSNSYTYNNSLRSQIPTYITPNSLTYKYMPSSYNNNNGSSINVPGSSNATPSYNYLVGSPSNRHSYSSRYMNGSPGYHVGSSTRLSYLNRCESNSSVSVLASTHSLPAC